MDCPYCKTNRFTRLKCNTSLGYDIFRCKECQRDYNKRTDTSFNRIEVPTDIVFEVLLCRVRYKLSYRDVAEYFLFRGFELTHETVRDWEERFLALFTEQIRAKRKGKIGRIWKIDETYYPNQRGVVLSLPISYPRAIKEELGEDVKHQVLPCTAHPIEQSHRGIKQCYYPRLGFGEFESAQRFCRAIDEVRNFLRPIDRMRGYVSLNEKRKNFQSRISELKEIFLAA